MNPTVADAIFWVAVVACAIAQLAITRSVLGARRPELPADARVVPPRRSTELAWALIPALALAGVLALTWRTLHPAAAPLAPAGAAAALSTALPGARA
jgi:heme/copper-type cytochrome/quinol oxidase subunit 2